MDATAGPSENHSSEKKEKLPNNLPLWGNERTMNLNPLIVTNIQSSHYFRIELFKLKTYHQVVDEIYYKVSHLEPWERGSRREPNSHCGKMPGMMRGVSSGGIVSTAFCLLYKLFTLRLTRKQVNGLISHTDSPYIRALGFMYIRFTQPPKDLFSWYDDYLEDDEELDVKAGGGHVMKIGALLRHFLTKLDWFCTRLPRIPVPVEKEMNKLLAEKFPDFAGVSERSKPPIILKNERWERSRDREDRGSSRSGDRSRDERERDRNREDQGSGRNGDRNRGERERNRNREDQGSGRNGDRNRDERERGRNRERDRSSSYRRSSSRDRRHGSRERSEKQSRRRSPGQRDRSRDRQDYRDKYRDRRK